MGAPATIAGVESEGGDAALPGGGLDIDPHLPCPRPCGVKLIKCGEGFNFLADIEHGDGAKPVRRRRDILDRRPEHRDLVRVGRVS